jgi:hypothetical protein
LVATRLAPVPVEDPVQTISSEEEALVVVRLLVAELSLVGDIAARAAASN